MSNEKFPYAVKRIIFLDGLRGVAILWVVLFHAFVRWPQIVPYGSQYADIPWLAHGWLGVELFFMISGFVIFMTLETSTSLVEFLLRRWLRLFPAMLICSILLYASAPLFPERPAGNPSYRDLLPGLTFIEPEFWARVLRSPQGLIEGAFWSLFVEVKFYLIAGTCYFLFGARWTVLCMLALFTYASSLSHVVAHSPQWDLQRLLTISDILGAKHFGWFSAGALFHIYFRTASYRAYLAAIAVGLCGALLQEGISPVGVVFSVLIVLLFASSFLLTPVRLALESRWLVFAGFVSYPLYLIHENMMIALIAKIGAAWPWSTTWTMPIMPFVVVVVLAWIVTKFIEPAMKRVLTQLLVTTHIYKSKQHQKNPR